MKKITIYMHSIVLLVFLISQNASGDTRSLEEIMATEQRVALVIGNSNYRFGQLSNPINDAHAMSFALRNCGFEVITKLNQTRKQMRQAIRAFGEKLKDDGVGLFYYAGHGIQVNGKNYLVGLNTDIASIDEVDDECLRVSDVLEKMEIANNRLNIIILDACRNNPFKSSFRSQADGLARMDAITGSIISYATAPGKKASDGGAGNHGLYTSALLKYIESPGLKIEDVFKLVRMDVMAASGETQVPWESSSLTGDFFFVPSNDDVVVIGGGI